MTLVRVSCFFQAVPILSVRAVSMTAYMSDDQANQSSRARGAQDNGVSPKSSERTSFSSTQTEQDPALTPTTNATEHMSPEKGGACERQSEYELRQAIKRERNKKASAKCRKKKDDLIKSLQKDVEGLRQSYSELYSYTLNLQEFMQQHGLFPPYNVNSNLADDAYMSQTPDLEQYPWAPATTQQQGPSSN